MTTPDHQTWWSAAELADAGLPGIPTTKRRVNDLAMREGWDVQPGMMRRRKARGGGKEYHWSVLPLDAQVTLSKRSTNLPEKSAKRSRDVAWSEFEAITQKGRDEANKRLKAVKAVYVFSRNGMSVTNAIRSVSEVQNIAERTLWMWLEMVDDVAEEDWLAYLAPKPRGKQRGSNADTIDEAFRDRVKSDYLRLSQPSFTSCYDRAVRWAKAEGISPAPIHAMRRWYKASVSIHTETLARKGLEALQRMFPAQIRDRSGMHAMEGVNGDYHKFDNFVRMQTPDGVRVVRPQMIAWQDLYSNKIVAWRLSYSANSHAVQLCFGDMVEAYGIPKHVLVDNGREFAAKMMTGGAKTRFRFKLREDDVPGLITALGCQVHWATPGAGQSKPIERAFRDLADRVSKHPAFEGAYTGNRPDAKPEDYGTRAIAFDEFERVVNEEIIEHNARPDRRSDVAFGRSFDDVFNESYANAPIQKATAEQRRLWLMGAEGVNVPKATGRISFMGNEYFSEFLHHHLGSKVVVRFDDQNLWDGLHVYSMLGVYLGHAPCEAKIGFFDAYGAKSVKRARKAVSRAQREVVKAEKKLTAAQLAASMPRAPEPRLPPEAKVVRLAKVHPKAPRPAPRDEFDGFKPEQLVTSIDTKRPARIDADDERVNFARAERLEAALAIGKQITSDEARWLTAYQTLPEYQAMSEIRALQSKTTEK